MKISLIKHSVHIKFVWGVHMHVWDLDPKTPAVIRITSHTKIRKVKSIVELNMNYSYEW